MWSLSPSPFSPFSLSLSPSPFFSPFSLPFTPFCLHVFSPLLNSIAHPLHPPLGENGGRAVSLHFSGIQRRVETDRGLTCPGGPPRHKRTQENCIPFAKPCLWTCMRSMGKLPSHHLELPFCVVTSKRLINYFNAVVIDMNKNITVL